MDLRRQHDPIKQELMEAFEKVLTENQYILGERVVQFENELAHLTDTKFAVGVGSGTDALRLSLRALDIGPGDEVITTTFSFVASADIIVRAGAKPVFIDIQPDTYNLSSEQAKAAINPKTKAIIAVHLYGLPCNMSGLQPVCKAKNVWLIEDCAQALGAEIHGRHVGSWGIIGCHSFFPTKTLGGFGDGGACTLSDAELASRLRALRQHGARTKYYSQEIGYKSRLDAIQAALLLVKLRQFPKWAKQRTEAAKLYNKRLAGLPVVLPVVPDGRVHAFHQYTIRTEKRDELAAFLKKAGISVALYYPVPIHLQPAFEFLGLKEGSLPEAEKAAKEVLSLPIFPGITPEEIDYVGSKIEEFFKGK